MLEPVSSVVNYFIVIIQMTLKTLDNNWQEPNWPRPLIEWKITPKGRVIELLYSKNCYFDLEYKKIGYDFLVDIS